MATYAATIPSTWSADETFSYLAVFSNSAHWDPGVLAGEQLDPGPVHAGTRFRIVVPFLGRRLALIYKVTHISAEDREVVLEAVSKLLRARDRITVKPTTPVASDAVVSYQADVEMRGPLRLIDPVLSRGFAAVGDRAAAGLAGVLSSHTGAAASS